MRRKKNGCYGITQAISCRKNLVFIIFFIIIIIFFFFFFFFFVFSPVFSQIKMGGFHAFAFSHKNSNFLKTSRQKNVM
jgi:ATP-dependent Zn protease